MIGYDAGAPEAQRDPGPAVPIIVDQELGSERARKGLIFKLETDAAFSMRPNADQVGVLRL